MRHAFCFARPTGAQKARHPNSPFNTVLGGVPKRKLFIAVHDYQHGAVVVRVYANSKDEVSELLHLYWDIYEDTDPTRPRWDDESTFDTSDILEPSKLLKKLTYSDARQAEGKRRYIYKASSSAGVEYREIWAHSNTQIESRFPHFDSMVGVGIGREIFDVMGTSDIEVADEFFRRHST